MASVCENHCLSDIGSLSIPGKTLLYALGQFIKAIAFTSGNINHRKAFENFWNGQTTEIRFILHNKNLPFPAEFQSKKIILSQANTAIDNQQYKIRRIYLDTCTSYTFLLNRIIRIPDTGGVNQAKRYSSQNQIFLNSIASGPRYIRYNSASLPE